MPEQKNDNSPERAGFDVEKLAKLSEMEQAELNRLDRSFREIEKMTLQKLTRAYDAGREAAVNEVKAVFDEWAHGDYYEDQIAAQGLAFIIEKLEGRRAEGRGG